MYPHSPAAWGDFYFGLYLIFQYKRPEALAVFLYGVLLIVVALHPKPTPSFWCFYSLH
jgi:hypothetical protein